MIRALILEDRDDYLRALHVALRYEFDVVTAQTMDGAKRALDASVQVALIDVRLAEDDEANRDGLLFLQWAKECFPNTPIVLMSAYRDFDAVVEALNLGADYFLRKPIDLRELKRLLREFGEKGPQPERTDALRRRFEQSNR